MTLEEKIALCEGKNCWETREFPQYGIPSMFMCDGPHGLRKQEEHHSGMGINASRPATCFPTAVTTACSWDVELLGRIGTAIGEEAADQGVGVVLGPGLNIKRNPLCGRNFEYLSEDPYLAGKLAASFVRNLQKNGVGACLKHFAGNNQEYKRLVSDSILDERTLREIYLTAFEIAVREGKPKTVMCAYNKLNGTYCSDNGELLTRILREEWGFDGLVMTDWGAMNDRMAAFRAGCDLNMPGGSNYMAGDVLAAVARGELDEADIDRSVRRITRLV
ncbi:MAG TPA: glycoside hydrolase family 3 protein, partial [Firmicutes bacterium]|nr:glycoside hydrolase family 3 protein [Bacillota bacterium]